MKYLILLLAGFTLCSLTEDSPGLTPKKERYLIQEKGRWGYIDVQGKVVIPTIYRNAFDFSEGLASVRLNGTYGFIDENGEYVIPSRFDHAFPFIDGLALVYLDVKPYFIDHSGQTVFEHPYTEMQFFNEEGLSIVRTPSGKAGAVNRQGLLVVDTAFQTIEAFSEGRATVLGLNHTDAYSSTKDKVYEVGMIDPQGQMIIPYGRYMQIDQVHEGCCLAHLPPGTKEKPVEDQQVIVDLHGNERFVVPSDTWYFSYGKAIYSEGKAVVNVYRHKLTKKSSYNEKSYQAVVDQDGNIVFGNPDWQRMTPFTEGRAFVQDKDEQWFLINDQGILVTAQAFTDINYHSYVGNDFSFLQNGFAMVEIEEEWTVINRDGELQAEPGSIPGLNSEATHFGDFIMLRENVDRGTSDSRFLYGYWNLRTGTLVKPQFQYVNPGSLHDELIEVRKNQRTAYIDKSGEKRWQGSELSQSNDSQLNIDFMNRGYCYGASPRNNATDGFGGWGPSSNAYKEIENDLRNNPVENTMFILIDPKQTATFQKKYKGMKMYLVNQSQDTAYFSAQDSRLYLNLQALNKKGEWQDIEYLPSSWCGNSYHTLFLPPDKHWEFTIPQYEGDFKTKIRAKLLANGGNYIYSNEVEGFVNPGQFWKKPDYRPSGLMDPYYD